MVTFFQCQIRLSNIGHKQDVILDPCFERERANIAIKDWFPTPYLYLQLIIIHELGVLIPFTPFEAKLLVVAKVTRIKLHLMYRALLGISKSCSGGQRSRLLYGYFFLLWYRINTHKRLGDLVWYPWEEAVEAPF